MSEPIPALPCWLNGEMGNVRDAKVSVLDRGFIFGDGVYEVVPAYAGKPFRFEEHMARLGRSLGELRIRNPMDRAGWRIARDVPDFKSQATTTERLGNSLTVLHNFGFQIQADNLDLAATQFGQQVMQCKRQVTLATAEIDNS